MTRSLKFGFFFAVALAAAISLPAQALLIDDFTDASGVFTTPGPGVTFTSTPDGAPFGSIVGGVRESGAHNTSGGGLVDVFTKPGTLLGTPVMAYASAPGVTGAMELTYDAGGAGLGGGLGEDFTVGGDNAFEIAVNFADFPAALFIAVEDADGDLDSKGPFPMPGLITGGAPVGVPVPYAAFDPSIDFDKLTLLSFLFDAPTPATDLEVLFLDTTFVPPIPEPTTLAGLGIMGMLVMTRRRRS